MKNRNIMPETIDSRYTRQQETINKICEELGLVAFRPNYHAVENDANTVIVYTKEGHAYNKTILDLRTADEKGRICHIQNTDINGQFDLGRMNNGALDTGDKNFEDLLKALIKKRLESKEKHEELRLAGMKLCLFCSENDHRVCKECRVTKLVADSRKKSLE